MIRFTRFVFVSFLFFNGFSFSQSLELSSEQDSIRLGETLTLTVKFHGVESNLVSEGNKNSSLFSGLLDSSPLKKKILCTPEKLGDNTIGPYKIKIGNKEFVSNSVKIFVRESNWNAKVLQTTYPKKVKVGEVFSIVLSSEKNDLSNLKFKSHRVIVLKNTKRTINQKSINGVVTVGSSITFDLVIKLKGEHVIKGNFIENWSDNLVVEPIVLEAK